MRAPPKAAEKLAQLGRLALEPSTAPAGAPEPTPAHESVTGAGEGAPGQATLTPIEPTQAPLQLQPAESAPATSKVASDAPALSEPQRADRTAPPQSRAAAIFQVPAPSPDPGPQPRELSNSINLVLPPHVFDAIERVAISRRWTKKYLILVALKQFGVEIPDAALVPDGRKIRGRRLYQR
jgi:hypothetical protein